MTATQKSTGGEAGARLTPDQERFIGGLRRSDYRILAVEPSGQGAVKVVTDSVTFLVTPSGFAERQSHQFEKVEDQRVD